MSGPELPPRPEGDPGTWFAAIAEHLGSAYLRYSFTKGTVQEVDALVALLDLQPGQRVLDVGCGPGRHSHELARRGVLAHGVDLSERFVELARGEAPAGATFEAGDARSLAFDGEFDAAISLCEGAFGLVLGDGDDLRVLTGMRRAVRSGGSVVVSAFNGYFAVCHHVADAAAGATFDAATGVTHEWTEVRDEQGTPARVQLWTTCYTARELRLLAAAAGLGVEGVWSVEPGGYGRHPPTVDSHELLLVARRPGPAR